MFHRLSTIQKLLTLLVAVGLLVVLFNYRTVADTIVGLQVVSRSVDLENGLIGHWTFDPLNMGPNVLDVSGNGRHGNLVHEGSGTSTPDGVLVRALELDGTDDHVNMGSSIITGTGAFTASIWVKTSTADRPVIMQRNGGFTGTMLLSIQSTSFVNFRAGGTDGDPTNVIGDVAVADGQWHHVVGVRDSDGTLSIYIDGELDISESKAVSSVANLTMAIGKNLRDGGNTFNGSVDDFRMYNRALSAKEVQELYDIGSEGRTTKQSSTLSSGLALDSGLVGHWTFDGKDMTSNVADVSGQGNDGNLQGQTSTTTAVGVIGQALEFDGVDDYVDVSDSTSLDVSGEMTLVGWVKLDSLPTSGTTWKTIVGKGRDTTSTYSYHLGTTGSGSPFNRFDFSLYDGISNPQAESTTQISTGTWYYVAGTYDGSTLRLFVDGILEDEVVSAISIGNQSSAVVLGAKPNDVGTASYLLDGTIDDVRIYNRALSANEISRLYDLGKTTHIGTTLETGLALDSGLVGHWTFDGPDMTSNVADRSGQGNHGALQGQTSTTTAVGVIGQALSFDGSDDRVSVDDTSSLDISGTHSISAWVRLDDPSSGLGYVVSKTDFGQDKRSWHYSWDGDNSRWGMAVSSTGTSFPGELTHYRFSDTLVAAQWYHVVFVYDSGAGSNNRFKAYVDGVSHDATVVGDDSLTPFNNDVPVTVGSVRSNGSYQDFWNGDLDDVRIYNRALSADEVSRLYQLGR